MARYIALLRGINVGGRNPIRMADLRACFEEQGFENVATWGIVEQAPRGFGTRPDRYLRMTIRSWSTTVKLLRMMDSEEPRRPRHGK